MIFTLVTDVSSGLTTFIFRKLMEALTIKLCIKIRMKIKQKIAELILKQHKKMLERRKKRKQLCIDFNIDSANCTNANVELAQARAETKLLAENFSVINNKKKEENFWVSLFTITKQDLLIFLIVCFISPFEIINKLLNIKF